MAIGQELLNVPMGDMIRQMAFAIADAQYQLDENSIAVAELMGGLQTITDDDGDTSFDDSRVFFGYEYMTLAEAVAYAAVDDAVSGTLDAGETVKLLDIVKKAASEVHGVSEVDSLSDAQKTLEIRVPTRVSMLELGFAPTFYQFVDTIIEVKIAIKITRSFTSSTTRSERETSSSNRSRASSGFGVLGGLRRRSSRLIGTERTSSHNTDVQTSQVDASYSSRYSYSAEGASLLRTKLSPIPPPPVLEDRIRSLMDNESARRTASLAKKRQELGLDDDE